MSALEPERCVTCSDGALEGVVVHVDGPRALVRIGRAEVHVAVDLVPDAAPGDLLLCHAGIALERLERSSAEPSQ